MRKRPNNRLRGQPRACVELVIARSVTRARALTRSPSNMGRSLRRGIGAATVSDKTFPLQGGVEMPFLLSEYLYNVFRILNYTETIIIYVSGNTPYSILACLGLV